MRFSVAALVALILVGCGVTESTTFSDVGEELPAPASREGEPRVPPTTLSVDELDDLAADIQLRVADVDEAFCDAGDGDPMANCYIGIATADEAEATSIACDSALPIIEEWTSGTVSIITFDSRDDQTIGLADC